MFCDSVCIMQQTHSTQAFHFQCHFERFTDLMCFVLTLQNIQYSLQTFMSALSNATCSSGIDCTLSVLSFNADASSNLCWSNLSDEINKYITCGFIKNKEVRYQQNLIETKYKYKCQRIIYEPMENSSKITKHENEMDENRMEININTIGKLYYI